MDLVDGEAFRAAADLFKNRQSYCLSEHDWLDESQNEENVIGPAGVGRVAPFKFVALSNSIAEKINGTRGSAPRLSACGLSPLGAPTISDRGLLPDSEKVATGISIPLRNVHFIYIS
jgi:hypothetical protein